MDFVFELNPIAASRPRVSKFGHAYFSGPYKVFRERCTGIVPNCIPEGHVPYPGYISVDLQLWVTKPKTTKLKRPGPDVDNYAKSVLDACNGKLWVDDKQIYDLRIRKEWNLTDRPEGYFEMRIEEEE